MKKRLIAMRPFSYAHRALQAGDEFDARSADVKWLTGLRRARIAGPQPTSTYKTRALAANPPPPAPTTPSDPPVAAVTATPPSDPVPKEPMTTYGTRAAQTRVPQQSPQPYSSRWRTPDNNATGDAAVTAAPTPQTEQQDSSEYSATDRRRRRGRHRDKDDTAEE